MRRKKIFAGDLDMSMAASTGAASVAQIAESEEAGQVRSIIWSAVDQLSPAQRATVLLFYRNDFGCHEISRVLQLPVATVKSHLHRARAKLKELLEGAWDQESQTLRNSARRAG